jgi:hypothetical protein
MIIETKLDFNGYLKLMYTLTYRKPIVIFLTIIGWTMFIGSILYFMGFNIPADSPPYFHVCFGFFVVAILPFSIYWSGKKNFASNSRIQERIVYEFIDDKIKITGETFNSELGWEQTYKIKELKNWILIFQNRQSANILPKEAFGEKLNDFRMLVKSKHVKANLK